MWLAVQPLDGPLAAGGDGAVGTRLPGPRQSAGIQPSGITARLSPHRRHFSPPPPPPPMTEESLPSRKVSAGRERRRVVRP